MPAGRRQKYGILKRKENTSKLKRNLFPAALILWLVAVMWFGTQKAALAFNYHPALGTPVFQAFDMYWYHPWEILNWAVQYSNYPQIKQIIEQCQLIFAIPLIMAGLIYMALTQGIKGRDDLHGSARWAELKDIKLMGYFEGQGVYVGGWWDEKRKSQLYLRHNGPEHILCFAPTRSGKGVGLILPTLLSWPHSSVVLDIKGENYALTTGYLKSLGNIVLRFDPSDNTGASAAFNSLEEIRLDGPKAIPDTQQIASMVMDPDGKGLEDYWNKAAFGFFGGALLHCLITTKAKTGRCASLYDVSVMLEDPNRQGGIVALFEEMKTTDHAALLKKTHSNIDAKYGAEAHIFIASAAQGMLAKADKEQAGVVSSATANLALYRDPVVAQNISRCDFRLHDLMNYEKPVNLYLVISPADIDRLRPLLRIFVAQLLGRFTEHMEFAEGTSKAAYKHRLLLMLDEFTSLGKLAIIERAIAYMAGYGVKGYFIVQDTKQLNQVYGQDNALMANCHVRIAYAPNIPETAEYLSKLTGTTTVVDKKISVSGSGKGRSRSTSISETARPLLTPDECLRLPGPQKDVSGKVMAPGDMLIFTAGQPPIYGRQILYFLDPVFSPRAKMPAPGLCPEYPGGVCDSIYFPKNKPVKTTAKPQTTKENLKNEYERYLNR